MKLLFFLDAHKSIANRALYYLHTKPVLAIKSRLTSVKMAMRLLLAAVLLGYCLAGPTNKHASSKDREHVQPDLSGELII